MKKLLVSFLLLVSVLSVSAQEKRTTFAPSEEILLRLDSLRLDAGLSDEIFSPYSLLHQYDIEHPVSSGLKLNDLALPRKSLYEPMILQWHSGGLTGGSYEAELKGLMAIRSANLLAVQRIGNVTISGGGVVNRMAWFRGLHTSFGLQGAVDWKINEHFSLHVFGQWIAGNQAWFYGSPTTTPGMVGYVPYTNFGLTFDVGFNEHWGMDVGAQAYRQSYRGNLHVAPIVAPYYRFNDGQKISVDVGGILYEILRSKINKNHYNPTIAPIGGIGSTPVAPRR